MAGARNLVVPLVPLVASGCTLLFDPGSASMDSDAAPDVADAAAFDASEETSDARPFDCDSLRMFGGNEATYFDPITEPIYAGNPLKFAFELEGGLNLGVEIVGQAAASTPRRAERISGSCGIEGGRQAAHCGVEEAGAYCAFLTSRDDETLEYHAAVEIEVLDGGPEKECSEILEEDPDCNWTQITDCSCLPQDG